MDDLEKSKVNWAFIIEAIREYFSGQPYNMLYNYLKQEMHVESVMVVLEFVEHLNTHFRPKLKHYKCEEKSKEFELNAGNALKYGQYQEALKLYNLALVHAPKNSDAKKLAYKGRSTLFARLHLVSAALNDLNIYFLMEDSDKIDDDLKKRKRHYENQLLLSPTNPTPTFVNNFFKLNDPHPLIRCASTDLDVVMEDSQMPRPTIVAAKDIKVGTVLAVEKAFTSSMCEINTIVTCYYCHKMALNLTPCDTCCLALFCNEECKKKCLKEYHNIECKIFAIFDGMHEIKLLMAIRAMIKIRNMCKNWGEFIEYSKKVKEMPNQYGSYKELYDRNNKISLLLTSNDGIIRLGAAYNNTIQIALFLNCLREIPLYFTFTNFNEELAVKKAIINIMMPLMLFQKSPDIFNVYKGTRNDIQVSKGFSQWFSFIGKIKHDCNPNALIVGLNDEAAVVALRPIEKGSPLTISYINHVLEKIDSNQKNQILQMYTKFTTVCSCQLCTKEWSVAILNADQLSKEQHFFFMCHSHLDYSLTPDFNDISRKFKIICKALTLFKDYPNSDLYRKFFETFCLYMFEMKCVVTEDLLVTN